MSSPAIQHSPKQPLTHPPSQPPPPQPKKPVDSSTFPFPDQQQQQQQQQQPNLSVVSASSMSSPLNTVQSTQQIRKGPAQTLESSLSFASNNSSTVNMNSQDNSSNSSSATTITNSIANGNSPIVSNGQISNNTSLNTLTSSNSLVRHRKSVRTQGPAGLPASATSVTTPIHSHTAISNPSKQISSSSLNFESILKITRKVKFIDIELKRILENLGSNSLPNTNSFQSLCELLSILERKFNEDDKENITIDNSMKSNLLETLHICLNNLKKLIDSLFINPANVPKEKIRLSYFSLFSLFIDLMSICQIIDPSITTQQSNHSIQLSNSVKPFAQISSQMTMPLSRSQSQVQLNTTTPGRVRSQTIKINRTPTISNNSSSNTVAPMRQPSISGNMRQPLRIDTNNISTFSRQDSELNSTTELFPATASVGDDERIYELIDYTIQAAHVKIQLI
ncbi:unnamed protein product [[Candida] boidinii]|nr:unnamed protein product [[Candida] boidinii]